MVAAADKKGAGQEAAPLPDAPPAAAPVAFDAALTAGGVFAGSAVLSVRLVLADGRVMRLELPQPVTPPAGRRLTAAEANVLEVVESMRPGTVMSAEEIVVKAGWKITTEIRHYIRSLTHLVVRHTRGWERVQE